MPARARVNNIGVKEQARRGKSTGRHICHVIGKWRGEHGMA